jgi:hypothetical protein
MFRIGADAWDSDELFQFVEQALAVLFNKGFGSG